MKQCAFQGMRALHSARINVTKLSNLFNVLLIPFDYDINQFSYWLTYVHMSWLIFFNIHIL